MEDRLKLYKVVQVKLAIGDAVLDVLLFDYCRN